MIAVADLLLLRRNGWRRMHRGRLHSSGWWHHEDWNWLPVEQAISLSKAWEEEAQDRRVEAERRRAQIVSELEAELEAVRTMPTEDLAHVR